MDKNDIVQIIKKEKMISVIRGENQNIVEQTIDAIVEGGIHLIEITMTVPNAIELIENLIRKYENTNIIIGAGTVLDEEKAKKVINAGAKFVVSPVLDENVIKVCNENNILVIPGVATTTEAYNAMKYGAEILKLFPSNIYGPSFIKTIKGPFPNIQIIPTGGVSLENLDKWLEVGAIAVGVGGEFSKCAKEGNFEKVKELAKEFVNKITIV